MSNGPIEFVKKPLELKIYGNEVKINRPTFGLARQWKKKLKEQSGDEFEILAEFLQQCGMTEDLLNQLELGHLKMLQEILLVEGDSKKN